MLSVSTKGAPRRQSADKGAPLSPLAVVFRSKLAFVGQAAPLPVHARLEANGRDHSRDRHPRSAKSHRHASQLQHANLGTPERRGRCLFSFAFHFSLCSPFRSFSIFV